MISNRPRVFSVDWRIQWALTIHCVKCSTDSLYGRSLSRVLAKNFLICIDRHGWGITPSADAAIHYLSLAASNSAAIESAALSSGSKAGGDAKGELVLAIFELANCFRYGWGVKIDKVAARSYYEVAANLGDPDALEEAAWCFMEGFGGPKDKVCYDTAF